ncbi:MAG: hypothetical protein JKP92_05870 [Alphaproteobacteria bacterium]|jgi:heme/copper-type cytochrome/quinol oxidase subunit 2|nr:hypothetical protein [Alphaproteobacteria bacterium]
MSNDKDTAPDRRDYLDLPRASRGGRIAPPSLWAERLAQSNLKNRIGLQQQEQRLIHAGFLFCWVIGVVTIWMVFIMAFLSLYTFGEWWTCHTFQLEKEIIITLLATTTVNIIGLPYIITRALFPDGKIPTQ